MTLKSAVLVGCNYPGTNTELHGCVNDVKEMYKMLVTKFGFAPENVLVLVDTDSNCLLPTGENIRKALHAMVQGAKPGDTFFFHFSGHGIRIPVDAGEVDDTGFDECICPCDCNFIDDDDFRELVTMLPAGTTFTIVSDSCQSGGLIDQAKEQIGNSFDQLTMEEVAPDPLAGKPHGTGEQKIVKKELSAESMVEMLRKQSGREDIEVSNLRSSVWEVFGEQASSKLKKQAKGIGYTTSRSVPKEPPAKKEQKGGQKGKVSLKKKRNDSSSSSSSDESDNDDGSEVDDDINERSGGVDNDEEEGSCVNDEDEEEEGSPDGDDEEEVDEDKEGSPDIDDEEGSPDVDDDDERTWDIDDETAATYAHVEPITGMDGNVGVLVSGCQSHQTSADVRDDPPHGALTNGIITVLQMLEPGESITNRQLVMRIRRYLASNGFTQEPGLYCSDEKADQPFICTPVN